MLKNYILHHSVNPQIKFMLVVERQKSSKTVSARIERVETKYSTKYSTIMRAVFNEKGSSNCEFFGEHIFSNVEDYILLSRCFRVMWKEVKEEYEKLNISEISEWYIDSDEAIDIKFLNKNSEIYKIAPNQFDYRIYFKNDEDNGFNLTITEESENLIHYYIRKYKNYKKPHLQYNYTAFSLGDVMKNGKIYERFIRYNFSFTGVEEFILLLRAHKFILEKSREYFMNKDIESTKLNQWDENDNDIIITPHAIWG